MAKNKRRHRRQTVRILVDYHFEGGSRCDYATTLGAGGLFIETEEPIAPGCIVKILFRLPHSDALHELEGQVTWKRAPQEGDRSLAPGMGIQFSDPAATAELARELDHIE